MSSPGTIRNWTTLTTALLMALLGLFLAGWSSLELRDIRRNADSAVRYQAAIIGNQVDDKFSRIDTILRHIADQAQRSRLTGDLSTEFRDLLRQELLLNLEILCLTVYDHRRELVWHSPVCVEDDHYRAEALENHLESGIQFSITVDQDREIHFSRSIRGAEEENFLFFDAVINNAVLLPQADDPLFEETLAIALQDADLRVLLLQEYHTTSLEYESLLQEDVDGDALSSATIRGGTHAFQTGAVALGRYQLPSFPYHTTVAITLEDRFGTWRGQLVLALFLVAVLGLLFWIAGNASQQRTYYRIVEANNSALERLNRDLREINRERELLVKEVHHRVKNNLTLINSIIQMIITRGGPYSQKTLEDLNSRILAIQKVHDSLFRSDNLVSVPVDEYVGELVSAMVESISAFPVRLTVRVEKFLLPSKMIIPLGILVAEIVTNAIKYGLEPEGNLSIRGDVSENTANFSICNNGKPYDSDGTPGLGTILIRALISQLNGQSELTTGERTCFSFSFPIEE